MTKGTNSMQRRIIKNWEAHQAFLKSQRAQKSTNRLVRRAKSMVKNNIHRLTQHRSKK